MTSVMHRVVAVYASSACQSVMHFLNSFHASGRSVRAHLHMSPGGVRRRSRPLWCAPGVMNEKLHYGLAVPLE